jgi:AraC-like DNA-binding protein
MGGHGVTELPATQSDLLSAEPSLPAAFALHLAAAVQQCGGSEAALLSELNVPSEALLDPKARLSFARMSGLIERAIALTGEPALGALIGWSASVNKFGVMGFAALTAATLHDAIMIAVRYVPLITSVFRLHLKVEHGRAAIELEECVPFGAQRDFYACTVLIALGRMGQALTGQQPAGELRFAFPEPSYFARLPPEPSARLRFDEPRHQLVFDAALLALPVTSADPASHRSALELCERELLERAPGELLVQRVRRELFAADGGARSSAQVARAVGMAERTLKRRLAEQRTSYSELLERARHTRALELLRSELSIEDVAERLGYSDPANFTRAFRRWTGKSPRAVRKSARSV